MSWAISLLLVCEHLSEILSKIYAMCSNLCSFLYLELHVFRVYFYSVTSFGDSNTGVQGDPLVNSGLQTLYMYANYLSTASKQVVSSSPPAT